MFRLLILAPKVNLDYFTLRLCLNRLHDQLKVGKQLESSLCEPVLHIIEHFNDGFQHTFLADTIFSNLSLFLHLVKIDILRVFVSDSVVRYDAFFFPFRLIP